MLAVFIKFLPFTTVYNDSEWFKGFWDIFYMTHDASVMSKRQTTDEKFLHRDGFEFESFRRISRPPYPEELQSYIFRNIY